MMLVLTLGCAAAGDGSSASSFGGATVGTATTVGTTGQASSEGSGGMTTTGVGTESGPGTTTTADPTATATGPGDATGDTEGDLPCDAMVETFAVDPGWTSSGLPDGANAFAWSPSANVGAAAGEIGGTLQRSGNDEVYADTGIALAPGDCITASGLLIMPSAASDFNSTFYFGHFGSAGGPRIGIGFAENGDASVRVYIEAGGLSELAFVMDGAGTQREWSYAYDPETTVMSLTIVGVGSVEREVPAGMLGDVAAVDSFGFTKGPHETPEMYTGLLELWFDEITYTR